MNQRLWHTPTSYQVVLFFDENESNTKPYIQLNLGNVAMFGHYVGFTDEPVARCMCVLADDPAEDAK
jgi:hypothetical protein